MKNNLWHVRLKFLIVSRNIYFIVAGLIFQDIEELILQREQA